MEKQEEKKEYTTYPAIADKAGLTGATRNRFIKYMLIRWASDERIQCVTGYAEEWANRFKDGNEFGASDDIGQTVLRNMGVD